MDTATHQKLRGKRTLSHFGTLIGASKNTAWRWEAGQTQPDVNYSERLSEFAERKHFLKDWKLAGSMKLIRDLESAQAEIAEFFRTSIERTALELTE